MTASRKLLGCWVMTVNCREAAKGNRYGRSLRDGKRLIETSYRRTPLAWCDSLRLGTPYFRPPPQPVTLPCDVSTA